MSILCLSKSIKKFFIFKAIEVARDIRDELCAGKGEIVIAGMFIILLFNFDSQCVN